MIYIGTKLRRAEIMQSSRAWMSLASLSKDIRAVNDIPQERHLERRAASFIVTAWSIDRNAAAARLIARS